MAREMKDSGIDWIGKIPEDWELHRMKSCIADRTSGAWGNEALGDEGDIVCLRIADFDYARFCFKDTSMDNLTIRNYDKKTIDSLLLQKGDILIEKSGGGEKTPVGRTVLFDKDYPALYANFMDRLRCTDLVTSEWMQYVFVTFYKNEYLRNYIKQTTGIQNLDLTSMMASERIPVPTLSEQQRIVAFLDNERGRIDAVIEQTRASIEEYKKLKQAIITEAVTKGVRKNRPMKDSGVEWIGEIPAEWDRRKLKSFTAIISKGATPKDIDREFTSVYSVRYLKSENIVDNQLSEFPLFTISEIINETELKRSRLKEDDLLFVIAGASLGKVAIMKSDLLPANTNQAVCFLRLKKEYSSQRKYIWYALQSSLMKTYISINCVQSAQPNISMEDIGSYFIAVPSNNEHREILNWLDAKCNEIDRLIETKQHLLTELETYKKSVIYEYVTGKKEVPYV